MSFPVAVQSAIFYVLACTPCVQSRKRYRVRKDAHKQRQARAQYIAEHPDSYRHPSPFGQNPYWDEDIRMGPSLPRRGRGNKNSSQRKLTSAGQESSVATASTAAVGGGTPTRRDTDNTLASANGTRELETRVETSQPTKTVPMQIAASRETVHRQQEDGTNETQQQQTRDMPQQPSPCATPDDNHSINMEAPATATTSTSEGWNHKRYQREDEELWGSEQSRTHKLMDAIVKAGSSASRLIETRLNKDPRPMTTITDEDRAKFYQPTVIHPPVNDYHPPVVSNKPGNKEALQWMLQPPPPAKVMEGKVPVMRSTSMASSSTSRRRQGPAGASDVSLTRRMALEARLRHVDSNNAVTGEGRAVTPTSIDELGSGSQDKIQGTGTGGSSPSRPHSKRKNRRASMQRSNMASRNRSHSGSLPSSMDDPAWSSDEGGFHSQWRFPMANASRSGSRLEHLHLDSDDNANSGLDESGKVPKSATPPSTMSAALAMATVEARMAQAQAMAQSHTQESVTTKVQQDDDQTHEAHETHETHETQPHAAHKLETIISSDASSKARLDTLDTLDNKQKENAPPATQHEATASDRTVEAGPSTGASGSGKKGEPTSRSTGSSIDSGLALSA